MRFPLRPIVMTAVTCFWLAASATYAGERAPGRYQEADAPILLPPPSGPLTPAKYVPRSIPKAEAEQLSVPETTPKVKPPRSLAEHVLHSIGQESLLREPEPAYEDDSHLTQTSATTHVESDYACETCPDGGCPLYYRRRPRALKQKVRRRIKLDNRLNEPSWYRTYRCEYYGHYPTQWKAWPPGWLQCRYPHPGPHPYDMKPPMVPTSASTPAPSRHDAAGVYDEAPVELRPAIGLTLPEPMLR
ncbi:hypothetical protein Pan216_13870 [Planctomycetes bacterium Pan216]|uniref:Secreted protein n=1 Tax=Kolteria novifilia TaxID=2527975 RepID=A0A518B0Q5_9BACT|nr:hypothetical protein Pan216_13870 [Planctomycetes bacterium Pan216]